MKFFLKIAILIDILSERMKNMPFFSSNYETPGAGVPKGEPQKIGIIRYFIVAGRKFWDLIVLNLAYLLFSLIPILCFTAIGWFFLGSAGEILGKAVASEGITEEEFIQLREGIHLIISFGFGVLMTALLGSGSPRAGMSYVLRNYSREEHAFLWSDFWEYTKKYFLKGLLIFIIDLIFIFVILLDIYSYGNTGTFGGLIASYLAIFLLIMYILMHPYIYMLLVTFDLKLKDAYKNAFMLSAVRILQNIACLAAAVFMIVFMLELVYRWNAMLFILFIMVFSFPCLILDMNSFSVVKKYMIKEEEPRNGDEEQL